jgi:crotonobetainyl-CoA:carnitine CoA-transferase CaiB-like acyl-CoA transferase
MMMIAANADGIWTRLTELMGRQDLATDERYATHISRGERVAEVDQLVQSWTATMEFAELDRVLSAASIPHGLIYRAPDILNDPHFAAREMIQWHYDAALERDVPMPAVVPVLSRTPGSIRWVGAPVGAHTGEVLADIGVIPAAELGGAHTHKDLPQGIAQ